MNNEVEEGHVCSPKTASCPKLAHAARAPLCRFRRRTRTMKYSTFWYWANNGSHSRSRAATHLVSRVSRGRLCTVIAMPFLTVCYPGGKLHELIVICLSFPLSVTSIRFFTCVFFTLRGCAHAGVASDIGNASTIPLMTESPRMRRMALNVMPHFAPYRTS
ncbi:hypothetical protein EDB87DRAFT_952422 [Lactarius vividus]|nr:hypothetical protein EDB87DRAFT_952422 [Lactarius vividus]